MTISINNNLAHILSIRCLDKDKAAFLYRDEEISYAELFRKAASFSESLKQLRIGEKDRVVIYLLDTPAIPYIFLGALAVGAVPIVINPMLKVDSLRHIICDSNASAIICEKSNSSIVKNLAEEDSRNLKVKVLQDVFSVDSQSPNDEAKSEFESLQSLLSKEAEFSPIPLEEDHSAFWQYTSGTTGHPKAVQHLAATMIENHRAYIEQVMRRGNQDIYYSAAKMFFGYGFGATVLFPILSNATSVIDSSFPVSDFVVAKNIQKYKPTLFFGTPVIYQSIVNNKDYMKSIICPRIICISAGARLPEKLFNDWREIFGSVIYDGVGATEMGHIFISNTPDLHKAGASGKPLPGYEVKLVSENGGNRGVLWVKGLHKNLGYWNNESANKSKFVDGWYVTGDIFSVDDDGFYIYNGRDDEIFKSNGIWLSPVEVEQAIVSSIEEITECAIIPEYNENGHSEPAYYVVSSVPEDDQHELKEKIVQWVVKRYESAFAPKRSAIYFIDKLPRNDNGKLVRKNLKELRPSVQLEQV